MIKLPETETSYWKATAHSPGYSKLASDLKVDVVVIGGGIAGLTSAYLLKKAGCTVAVVEKSTIGSGVTGNTTGKITSQHNIVYSELLNRFGEPATRIYAEANQAALEQIRAIIEAENIECDWQREDNYVYTTQAKELNKFKKEAEVAQTLGLPTTYETTSSLPFEVKGVVRFKNQATFHVKKYLIGLAEAIHGNGSYVFENTRANVTGVRDSSPCRLKTNGGTITAADVIVATNVPFPAVARGAYCALEYPLKSYIVAGRPKNTLHGMYISPDSHHYSILPVSTDTGQLLLIGGEGHIPGLGGNTNARYQRLADYAQEQLGIESIEYRWSTRDYLSYDSIPLIGRLYAWSNHVYVTTAFMKWGLTSATVGGIILCDLITGKESAWAATFDSTRLKPVTSIPRVFAEHVGLR